MVGSVQSIMSTRNVLLPVYFLAEKTELLNTKKRLKKGISLDPNKNVLVACTNRLCKYSENL